MSNKQPNVEDIPRGDSPDNAFTSMFNCELRVQEKRAKDGFSQVTALNYAVQRNLFNLSVSALKEACAAAARCDITRRPLEYLVIASANSNTGAWSCWNANSQIFPKTAARRVLITENNIEQWIKEASGPRGREPGIFYIAPHPSKKKKPMIG